MERRSRLTCEAVDNQCLPVENQTTPEGLGFYNVAMNEEGKILNTPDIDPPYLWYVAVTILSRVALPPSLNETCSDCARCSQHFIFAQLNCM